MNEEKGFNKTIINWYPGHMAKTKREIKERLNLIDVIYEVIDARMPISSKIIDIDNLIKDKQKILIMSKYDLCDKVETDKFIKYYKKLGYTVIPINLINGNVSKILDKTTELMEKEFKKRETKGLISKNIKALVVGVPNAGKSTLINRLAGKKKAGTASRPGYTKQLSWIKLKDNIELLDSPGILWPKFEDQTVAKTLAALNSIKEEVVDSFEISNFILRKMDELYKERLKTRYGIDSLTEDLIEEYDIIAKKRGALLKGGIADYDKVSKIIIKDLQDGYLGEITFDRISKIEN